MDRVDIKTRLIPLLLLGLAVGSLYAEAPTITKHRVFSIPFFISDKSLTPGEVFLFVSGDQGKNWKLYQRRAPKVAKFDFQAGVDGEYWFVVGTDRNQFVPKEGTDPDKKVIVDNRQPTIDLQLESSSDGRIRATWKSYDTTLNAKSFRLSYRTTASPNWKALEVVLPDQLEDAFDGEASWMVADQDGTVEVTAQISDMAENEATVTRSLSFDDSLELVAEERTNDLRSSTSFVSSKTSRETHRPDNNDREQFGVWTSDTNEFDSTPLPWRNPLNSDADSDLLDPTLPLASFKESSTEPELPDPMGYTGESNQNESSTTPSDDQRAEAETILYSNSRQFNLEYDIADLDGELERVELWITQDGGKHWEPYGLDEDLVSPILVEVESEGQYGFRMLLHSQNGTSNRPPQNSDRPDVTIEVDTTRPDATIRSAEYRQDATGKRLTLNWDAHDRNLAQHPIILSYSNSMQGPWVIFARDIGNSGQYDWTPNVDLPKSFFVQLDMQDKAGNRTVYRFPKALTLKSGAQKAKVRFLQVIPQ